MKELSIEQKAKAYDEAIKRVENIMAGKCETTFMFTAGLFEHIFPELAESEDERIKKNIIATIHLYYGEPLEEEAKEMIAWLEKQGEHAKFRDSIQVGDKVTRNEDGVLVNLSQLNRVAKKDKKQGEQRSAEWSDNDEWCLEQINFLIRNSYSADDKVERLSNWLKSFKDRYAFKPSKEQLDGLKEAIEFLGCTKTRREQLQSLYEQLKKLKE